ncbi:hypothetical protein N752_06120 [Desulforamulus aquiferis]|nr:hypothetical protein [Desulforamulus aquiferis]RYD06102.1 hypothetical protein N752_06120 [Desulforamulus aquiferis]
MWNKHKSHFIILKIHHGTWSFSFPIPLFIFDDLLRSLLDLVVVGECFTTRLKLPRIAINTLLQFLAELRQLGRWQMADITICKDQVSVSFY